MRHLLLLSPLLLALACGDKETPAESGNGSGAKAGLAGGGADAPSDIAALVPGDAHAVLVLSSLGEVERMAGEIAPNERVPPLAMALGQFGIDGSKIDPARALAVAARLPRGGMPQFAFILPAKDEAAAQALSGGDASKVRDGWVSVQRGQFGAPGGSRLVKGLPDAPVAFRADLAALLELHRGDLMGLLEAGRGFASSNLPGVDLGDAINRIVGWMNESLDAADLLDMSVDVEQGWIDFRMAYVAKEGSEIALAPSSDTLAKYAANVPAGYRFAVLFAFDLKEYVELVMSAATAQLPAKQGAALEDLMKDAGPLVDGLGSNWMFAASFRDHARAVGAVETADPAAYATGYMDWIGKHAAGLKEAVGLAYATESPRDVASHRVFGAKVAVDHEKLAAQLQGVTAKDLQELVPALFGESGPRIDLAPAGGRVVFGIGGGAIEEALGGSGGPAGFRQAIEHVGGSLGFLIHVELRGLVRQMDRANSAVRERVTGVPEGGPIPISLYGTRHGRRYSLGLYANVRDAMKLFKRIAR